MGYDPRMQDADALFETLRRSTDPDAVRAVEDLVRDGSDEELARVNAVSFAAGRGLDEEKAIAALLHASRLGLFEMSWNILCPSCGGVLDANATLKSVRQEDYHCAFCGVANEPRLDDTVEVSFTVSPRVRRIAAHDPDGLSFWDYHRQVFFGSGVAFPEPGAFDELSRKCVLEIGRAAGRRAGDPRPAASRASIIIFDPVTHAAHFIEVAGEPDTGAPGAFLDLQRRPRRRGPHGHASGSAAPLARQSHRRGGSCRASSWRARIWTGSWAAAGPS